MDEREVEDIRDPVYRVLRARQQFDAALPLADGVLLPAETGIGDAERM